MEAPYGLIHLVLQVVSLTTTTSCTHTDCGNQYAVVFQDCISEAFPIANLSAVTITQLLIEDIFCSRRAPL